MKKNPIILIIFGITGDLAGRYLLPAIAKIAKANKLPAKFQIVGITRQSGISIDNILNKIPGGENIRSNLNLHQMNPENIDEYLKLDKYLEEIEKNFSEASERIYYLSVPPKVSKSVITFLGKSGLSKVAITKLLLEKPFGTNLESAIELSEVTNRYWDAKQVYPVDHYLAKEISQNILIFRSGNSLFRQTWNKNFIESIEIIASEEIGIEGRANFYEETGALRDVVQNHLLELLALTLMELPDDSDQVAAYREKALKNLNIVCDVKNSACVKRGQYEGYREQVKNEKSMVETFVSIELASGDPNWRGVSIKLTAGKALKEKLTAIKILYKKVGGEESNELLLRIQPDAGIEFNFQAKIPGYEYKVRKESLSFIFKEHYKELPGAYEQVLYSAINSEHNLFPSGGEILESWRILDVLLKSWEKYGDDLIIYKKNSAIDEIVL